MYRDQKHMSDRVKQLALFCCTLALLPGSAGAQSKESFAEILVRANKFYEQGNLTEAINLATSCSIENAVLSDKWKAYRLLAMAYLADNQPELAREAAENMLDLNPTYKPNNLKDPTELIRLLKSIRVIPAISMGLALSAGSNTTFPSISKSYVTSDYRKVYEAQNSFQFGLSFGYGLTEKMGINAGICASQKAYAIDYSFAGWKVNVAEKLTYLNVPLQFRYAFLPEKKWRPYIEGGVFFEYLLFSKNDLASSYNDVDAQFELTNLNSAPRRNNFNWGLTGGAGLSYKVHEGQAFVQVNYAWSGLNITNTDTRYKYNDLIYTYYYIDDDMKLNNLTISFGYTFFMSYRVVHDKEIEKKTE